MFEQPSQESPEEIEKKLKKQEFIATAKELAEMQEGFPFPGIEQAAYEEIKASEEAFGEDYAKYATPIDELIQKFKDQGMKVVLAMDSESGGVHILPMNCDNDKTASDILFPWQLMATEDMDERLKKLISLKKK